ncbi:enhanced intracellular survival protein Eis [Paenibacillus sp. CF384]|uniref:GNAT family N-acetyltransferase n=1 Tax=Paenibacillus sp. CF384 TaxID=1884382 RepID=UPI0008989BED|nr:GNAT family N-acetyltransferase [Paenibacillus sp. CF384]SDW16631.1 Predicted acetyltransferase [Paenibacillus sp. CF384]
MIRTIRQEEAGQSLTLTQAAFAVRFSESDVQARLAKMNMEHFLGYFVEDQLAAQLAVLPLYIYVQGEAIAMGGIAHVASYPELRRQGMVSKLLVRSLEMMRESGQTVSMLNPFSYSFYRKYGWEYFSTQSVNTLDMSVVPKFGSAAGAVKRMSAEDWHTADQVYDRYARTSFNGMLRRDENWWRQHVFNRKLGSLAVYYDTNGEPTGYMLYDIKDRFMNIHELVHLDPSARNGLWQFIGNHDSIVTRLKFTAPNDDPFLFAMAEPKLQQEMVSNFMFRIVDAEAFIRHYRFTAESVKLIVRITDDHADWNRGVWELSISDTGRAEAVRLEDGDLDGVSCDIQTLSTMLIGCQRPAQLSMNGRLSGSPSEIARWERAIPRRVAYMTDFF